MFPALRRPNEQLDEVVVKAVVEVALEVPWELGALDVARVQRGDVDVGSRQVGLERNQQLDPGVAGFSGAEAHHGVLVALQFGLDLLQ